MQKKISMIISSFVFSLSISTTAMAETVLDVGEIISVVETQDIVVENIDSVGQEIWIENGPGITSYSAGAICKVDRHGSLEILGYSSEFGYLTLYDVPVGERGIFDGIAGKPFCSRGTLIFFTADELITMKSTYWNSLTQEERRVIAVRDILKRQLGSQPDALDEH